MMKLINTLVSVLFRLIYIISIYNLMLPVLLLPLGLQRPPQGVIQKIYNILYKKESSTNRRRYFVLLGGRSAKLRVLAKLQLMLLSILMLWLISPENKFSGEDFKSMGN